MASVTLTGNTAQVNATLASGLTYRASPNYNGTDTLTMLSADGGNTGSGGNKTDSDIVNIVVAAVNDAPSIGATKNANAIVRVSTEAAGGQGNGASFNPVFSPDGTKIAFSSDASNLVAGDTNNRGDIFVKDLASGAVTRVSTNAAGGQGEGGIGSQHPVFSPDGSKIAFDSFASNLVPGPDNFVNGIFVKDLVTGAITRTGSNSSSGNSNSSGVLARQHQDRIFERRFQSGGRRHQQQRRHFRQEPDDRQHHAGFNECRGNAGQRFQH